jgi:hypothetical protein
MCVTPGEAEIRDTRTYVHATTDPDGSRPVHVCGYQNHARSLVGPNCMFLNFAGTRLQLVRGPEYTRTLMQDMTADLRHLAGIPKGGGMFSPIGGSRSMRVEEYGDYDVVLAQGPGDILSMLGGVRPDRRPADTRGLREMIDFYMSFFFLDSYVLACFDGEVKPKHPIAVSYEPRDPSVLTIPGLDGHDGNVPVVGQPIRRDFHVAFGIAGRQLPYQVRYNDQIGGRFWAPTSVTGFIDNRHNGPNGDYVLPVGAVEAGLYGRELAAALR